MRRPSADGGSQRVLRTQDLVNLSVFGRTRTSQLGDLSVGRDGSAWSEYRGIGSLVRHALKRTASRIAEAAQAIDGEIWPVHLRINDGETRGGRLISVAGLNRGAALRIRQHRQVPPWLVRLAVAAPWRSARSGRSHMAKTARSGRSRHRQLWSEGVDGRTRSRLHSGCSATRRAAVTMKSQQQSNSAAVGA